MSGQSRETEAVKLMSIRAGLLDVSQAWEGLGSKCLLLAQAQKVTCGEKVVVIGSACG